jgi:hypothetical protein
MSELITTPTSSENVESAPAGYDDPEEDDDEDDYDDSQIRKLMENKEVLVAFGLMSLVTIIICKYWCCSK